MSATAANPYRRKGLLAYSPRVLLALQQAIGGSKDFFQWLVEAGYTETQGLVYASVGIACAGR